MFPASAGSVSGLDLVPAFVVETESVEAFRHAVRLELLDADVAVLDDSLRCVVVLQADEAFLRARAHALVLRVVRVDVEDAIESHSDAIAEAYDLVGVPDVGTFGFLRRTGFGRLDAVERRGAVCVVAWRIRDLHLESGDPRCAVFLFRYADEDAAVAVLRDLPVETKHEVAVLLLAHDPVAAFVRPKNAVDRLPRLLASLDHPVLLDVLAVEERDEARLERRRFVREDGRDGEKRSEADRHQRGEGSARESGHGLLLFPVFVTGLGVFRRRAS